MDGIAAAVQFRSLELRGSRQIRERGAERLRAGSCGIEKGQRGKSEKCEAFHEESPGLI